jgi:predicted enzyme related to lactoylglutathione lyase
VTIGEVCLLTNDVPRLAAFYKQLLGVENGSNDETHQFIISEGTALTVYNDGTVKNNLNQNICLAFTVDDIDKAYEKVLSLGARIIEPPAKRPWGAINMSFYDPDNNMVYPRSFLKNAKES